MIDSRVEVETVTDSKIVGVKTENVQFEFDGVDVPLDGHDSLKMVASFLENNSDTFAVLAGFTDITGAEEYNLKLSRVRALNVKNLSWSKAGSILIVSFYSGMAPPTRSQATTRLKGANKTGGWK